MTLPRVLVTPDLRLVATTLEHVDGLWLATQRSLAQLQRWMVWAAEADRDGTVSYATLAQHRWAAGLEWNFTIMLGDEVAGSTSLHRYDPVRRCAEIGYWIRTDLTGRGLATQAVQALVSFGFDALKLHRIELLAGVRNAGSVRVAEKAGFVREGQLRQATPGAAGWYDVYIFGLLASDRETLR